MSNQTQKINKQASFWLVLSLHLGLGAALYYYVQNPQNNALQPNDQQAAHTAPIVP
ncbi:MAG: hypothetical protein KGS48_19225 [Bacteroidetes bacterium]|nr:hypothetical protein [Bacteroidota bacterium]